MRKFRFVLPALLPGLLGVLLVGTSLVPASATEPPPGTLAVAVTSSESPQGPSTSSFAFSGENLSLTAEASGGVGPYTYAWSGPSGFASSDADISFTPAMIGDRGNYRVTATDSLGATAVADHFVDVGKPETLVTVAPDARFPEPGQPLSITADIRYKIPLNIPAPNGGTATFVIREAAGALAFQEAVPVANGSAAFTFTPETAGDYRVSAAYAGNDETTPAWSADRLFTVHPAATFAVSPERATVRPGRTQTFTVHVQPNEQVSVNMVPGPLEPAAVTADAAGVAVFQLTLPAGFQPGPQSLQFTGQSSGLSGAAAVQVESTPQAGLNFIYSTVDRAWGGQEVNGSVSGCPQYTYASLRLDGQPLTSTGFSRLIYGAEFTFRFPRDTPLGTHTLTAVCNATGAESNPVTFEVIDTALPDQVQGLMDVWKDSLFYDEVVWLVTNGISTGYDDGTYRPYLPINRDAMAAFLYRLAGSPDFEPPAVSPFTDVATDNQFYTEISWLAAEGISTGWEDRTFRPYEPINRDAMAAFLYRLAGSPEYEPAEPERFRDVPPGTLFHKEINWAAAVGITTGYGDGTFRPVQSIDREAVAAFLFRYDRNVSQQNQ